MRASPDSSALPGPGVGPLPLSVSIVCCNNRETVGRTVESVRSLAAEIIALDSGSTDGTVELLRGLGVTVVHQVWLGFVRQKQAALERCRQPWVLHLDSDESLEPALAESVRAALVRDDRGVAAYEVNRKVWYAGRFLEHAWQPERRVRLARRGCVRWGGADPHDALEVIPAPQRDANDPVARRAVRIERLRGDLRHDSIPTVAGFLAKQAGHAQVAAASARAQGRGGSLASLLVSPSAEFAKQVLLRSAWRDGWRGWVAAAASTAAVIMKHAALLELTHAPESSAAPGRIAGPAA